MSVRGRFLHALAFLTVLPVAASGEASLSTYAGFFPAVGIFVGLVSGTVFVLASLIWASLICTGLLPALLAIAASLILTGALHEDGLADTADGFGGGWTREQRLMIMKDSRLGTYGVLALLFSVALRAGALIQVPPGIAIFVLIAVHAGGRLAAVIMLATQDYAGDPATAKSSYSSERLPKPVVRQGVLWTALAVLPILIMHPFATISGVVLGGLLSSAMALYSKRAIGGYCGDVLGAIEQMFEIGCLLGLASMSAGA